MFQTKVENIETHILCSMTFLPKIVPFMIQCGKAWYNRTGHRWQYNRAQKLCNTYCICTAVKVTRTHFNVTFYVLCLVQL